METALHAKFTQNPRLRQMLCDTGNKLIIEANPRDNFWSCGLTLFDQMFGSQKVGKVKCSWRAYDESKKRLTV